MHIYYVRLCAQLREEKSLSGVTVAKLVKSGGVVQRERDFRHASRACLVKEYFYGPDNRLSLLRPEGGCKHVRASY